MLPLARLPFQPVTEAPRTVLPTGDRVFKHRSLGGTFLIQITSLCLLRLSDSLKSTSHRPPACLSFSDLGPKLSAHTSQWPCLSAAQGDSICFLFTKYLLCVIFCRSPSLDVAYTHTENQLWDKWLSPLLRVREISGAYLGENKNSLLAPLILLWPITSHNKTHLWVYSPGWIWTKMLFL